MLLEKNTITVSVLMTAYNREQYIAEAIESVLASSYTSFELIIVDDGSVDKTVEIAKNFESIDPRVKVYVNSQNLGDYPNRNCAAGYARGTYLKSLDSDDKIYPDGLKYCVEAMENNPDADWGLVYPAEIATEQLLNSKEAIYNHFFKKPFLKIGPGGTIIKRNFFFKIGKYPIIYGPANDMYFNLLAASKGKTLLLRDNFLFYRIHEGQEINNSFSYLYNNSRYLNDALLELDLPLTRLQITWLQKKRKRRFSVNIIKFFFTTGKFAKTREAIIKADFSLTDFLSGIFHYTKSASNRK